MKEAIVKCLCAFLKLADLNLELKQGDEVSLTMGEVMSSKDLKRAIRFRAVTITYRNVCKEQRLPSEEVKAPKVVPPVMKPHPVAAPVKAPAVQPQPSVIPNLVQELKKEMMSGLKQLLQELAPQVIAGKTTQVSQVSQDTPMFIPKGMVSKDTASVKVKTEQSDGGSLDNAAAVLKKARKGGKKND